MNAKVNLIFVKEFFRQAIQSAIFRIWRCVFEAFHFLIMIIRVIENQSSGLVSETIATTAADIAWIAANSNIKPQHTNNYWTETIYFNQLQYSSASENENRKAKEWKNYDEKCKKLIKCVSYIPTEENPSNETENG